jgi:hypothetical protein
MCLIFIEVRATGSPRLILWNQMDMKETGRDDVDWINLA